MLLTNAQPAMAAARRYHFDLPSAPLAESIARIGAETGASIATPDARLLHGTTRGLRLDGSIGDALDALLSGTQAHAVRIGGGVWRIEARIGGRRQPRPPRRPVVIAMAASDIVVTGSKRGALLSEYPASVTVLDGDVLSRYGATPDNTSIARVDPTLQSTHLGPGRDKLFLRGIADSSFNGSGPALVGRYVGDLRLTYNAPDPDLRLYDVSRVEILEGAQGTLYGAGSMAGLIRVTPHAPDPQAMAGEVWAGGSTVAHGAAGGDIGGVLNVPLADDRAALRLVAYAAHDGGYIDDAASRSANINATRTYGGRAALLIRLSGQWRLDVTGIFQDIRNRDAQYAERGLPPLTRSGAPGQPSYNLFRSGAFVLSGPVGALRFVSTTGIVGQALSQHFSTDGSFGESLYSQHDRVRLLSEEARLSSERDDPFGWVAGISLLSSKTDQTRNLTQGGVAGSLGRAQNDVTDLTAFGEVTVHVTTKLALTAGARLSTVRLAGIASGARDREAVKFKPAPGSPSPFDGVRHEHFFVPSLAASWRPEPSLLAFARYSQGYRPGGLTASGIVERYKSDSIASIEIGMRFEPDWSRRVSLQWSGVTSRWDRIQADMLEPSGLPRVENIGNGVVRSVTVTAGWQPSAHLETKLAATLARGSVTGLDVTSGETIRTPLPDVARDTIVASVDYHAAIHGHPVSFGFYANHVGSSVLGSGSDLSGIRQGGYWLVAFGAATDLGAGHVTIDIDNLFDSAANTFTFGGPAMTDGDRFLTPLRPRTIRIGFSHGF